MRTQRYSRRIARTSSIATTSLLVLLSFAAFRMSAAQSPGYDFRWDELRKQGRASGTVLPPGPGFPGHQLKVDNLKPTPSTVTVLTIDKPPIAGPRYVLRGQVRYDNVEGTSYLELWNYFPDGGQYFSRTLADQGPMMKLQGTSGWREFVLPFDATGAPPPTRLVMNVVLQGRGTVYLGPLRLSDEKGSVSVGPEIELRTMRAHDLQ